MGTTGGQRASARPSGTRGIALSASVVVDVGWRLGGPGPYGPAIGGVVRVVVAMAEMGRPGAKNWVTGSRVVEYATDVLRDRRGEVGASRDGAAACAAGPAGLQACSTTAQRVIES